MMRSLLSGVSGLKNHQTRMDVIGNNIANVNTVAYKSERVTFQDTFNQTLKKAEGGGLITGGTNPSQVGHGSSVASIDTIHTTGGVQRTDYPLIYPSTGRLLCRKRQPRQCVLYPCGKFPYRQQRTLSQCKRIVCCGCERLKHHDTRRIHRYRHQRIGGCGRNPYGYQDHPSYSQNRNRRIPQQQRAFQSRRILVSGNAGLG